MLVPLGLISLAYCVPLLFSPWRTDDGGRRLRLKELPGVKTLIIAVVWAAATVLLPAIEANLSPFDTSLLEERTREHAAKTAYLQAAAEKGVLELERGEDIPGEDVFDELLADLGSDE